jgi:putative FmdB family regulatory protein
MPTYEYVCRSCGTHVEVFQHFSDPPLTECGVCGGQLRKVFHPAGILFKGSGFYATDSRRRSSSSSDGGSSKGDESSGGKSSESKEGAGTGSKESKGSKDSTESTSGEKKAPGPPSSGTKEKSA